MFWVYCTTQDTRENYKHSACLHSAAQISQSRMECQWREAYVIMSFKLAPISHLREPLPAGVWMHRSMASCAWRFCVGFVDSLLQGVLAERWESAENLLTCCRGSFKHPLSRGFIFFCQALVSLSLSSFFLSPLSFNIAPSCLARHKALHRALVKAAVFLCLVRWKLWVVRHELSFLICAV